MFWMDTDCIYRSVITDKGNGRQIWRASASTRGEETHRSNSRDNERSMRLLLRVRRQNFWSLQLNLLHKNRQFSFSFNQSHLFTNIFSRHILRTRTLKIAKRERERERGRRARFWSLNKWISAHLSGEAMSALIYLSSWSSHAAFSSVAW